jgi:hypothetical protein
LEAWAVISYGEVSMPKPMRIALTASLAHFALAVAAWAQSGENFEQPPISYSATVPHDGIAAIEARIATGELKLSGTSRTILLRLLEALHVPVETQMLVFSKTSFQRARINPRRPRALYFSDTCYIGWVPGGLIEVTTIDPTLGPVFYSFSPQRSAAPAGTVRFVRDEDCLRCHGGNFIREIPAVFARSVFADENGEPLLRFGSQVVDHRTPFAERWGGWYVTGRHGAAQHRGNSFARDESDQLVFDPARGSNLTDLSPFLETSDYPTGTSDIVALLVFEHQLATQNAITHAGQSARRMLHYQAGLQRQFKTPITEEPEFDSVKSVFDSAAHEVVDALLSKGEAELPAGIAGRTDFAAAFQAGVPRSRAGDSLKDLQLTGHLYRNRCSYLIYSDSFRALPSPLKQRVYTLLAAALDLRQPDPRYAYLPADERARIRTILRETHPELGSW